WRSSGTRGPRAGGSAELHRQRRFCSVSKPEALAPRWETDDQLPILRPRWRGTRADARTRPESVYLQLRAGAVDSATPPRQICTASRDSVTQIVPFSEGFPLRRACCATTLKSPWRRHAWLSVLSRSLSQRVRRRPVWRRELHGSSPALRVPERPSQRCL